MPPLLLTLALAAVLALPATAGAQTTGVNRLDSEQISWNELSVLGQFKLSYRVAFWQDLSDAQRDELVLRSAVAGVRLLPILIVRYDGVAHEPRGAAWREWLAYVRHVVRRYPYIRSWEIWNEPNMVRFGGAFAVHRWKRFVSRTARVIHNARADARVVAGGVSVIQRGWRRYLSVSGVDAVGVHPYANTAARALRFIRESRRIARKPVWVTEMAWTGGGARYAARQLGRFRDGYRGPLYWYHLQDHPLAPYGSADDGLFRQSWKVKPAWWVLVCAPAAGQARPLRGTPCPR